MRYPVPRAAKKLGLVALSALGKSHGFAYELLWRGSAELPIFWGGVDAFSSAPNWSAFTPLATPFQGPEFLAGDTPDP